MLATIVSRQSSSEATKVALNMKNKKLSSGLIHPGDTKAGFFYYEKSQDLKIDGVSPGSLQGELLDLSLENKKSIVTQLSAFR